MRGKNPPNKPKPPCSAFTPAGCGEEEKEEDEEEEEEEGDAEC